MPTLSEETLLKLNHACHRNFPKETCGIITQEGEFIELPNQSDTPETAFVISTADIGAVIAQGKQPQAIVHSHTKVNPFHHICTPSVSDISFWEEGKIPWLICGFDGFTFTPPLELPARRNPNYLARPYILALQDCGTLLADFFFFEFGITLNINPRRSLVPRRQWGESFNGVAKELDFKFLTLGEVQELRKGDVLVTSVLGGRANHGMIYLGNEFVLNQGEFSTTMPLSQVISSIEGVYRYAGLVG